MPRQTLHASTRLPSQHQPGLGGPDATLRHVETERELRVTLAGDRSGDDVIVEEPEDGLLILAPDTSMGTIRHRHGLERATLAEFEAEYGPLQPPDGEG